MLVTANGVVTRLNAGSISRQGRPATGVRAQNLNENDSVVSVNKIINPDENDVTIKTSSSSDFAEQDVEEIQQTSLLEDTSSEE
jgi:DNA gyrase/topoisomerase IV subunit A